MCSLLSMPKDGVIWIDQEGQSNSSVVAMIGNLSMNSCTALAQLLVVTYPGITEVYCLKATWGHRAHAIT